MLRVRRNKSPSNGRICEKSHKVDSSNAQISGEEISDTNATARTMCVRTTRWPTPGRYLSLGDAKFESGDALGFGKLHVLSSIVLVACSVFEYPSLGASPKNLDVEVLAEREVGVLAEREEGVLQRRVELITTRPELPQRNMELTDEPDFDGARLTRTPPMRDTQFLTSSVWRDGTVSGILCRSGCRKVIAFSYAVYVDSISSRSESSDDLNLLKFLRFLKYLGDLIFFTALRSFTTILLDLYGAFTESWIEEGDSDRFGAAAIESSREQDDFVDDVAELVLEIVSLWLKLELRVREPMSGRGH